MQTGRQMGSILSKRRFEKLFTVFCFILSGEMNSKSSAVRAFASQFRKDYTVEKRKIANQKESFSSFSPRQLKLEIYREFKSKKPVFSGSEKIFLRFSLSVLKYRDRQSALEAFLGFKKNPGTKFIKSPTLIVLKKKRIYDLSGKCLYSGKNWNDIESKLLSSLNRKKPVDSKNIYKIPCGGKGS